MGLYAFLLALPFIKVLPNNNKSCTIDALLHCSNVRYTEEYRDYLREGYDGKRYTPHVYNYLKDNTNIEFVGLFIAVIEDNRAIGMTMATNGDDPTNHVVCVVDEWEDYWIVINDHRHGGYNGYYLLPKGLVLDTYYFD